MHISKSFYQPFKGYTEDIKIAEGTNKKVHQMNLTSSSHILRRLEERMKAPKTEPNFGFAWLLNYKFEQLHQKLTDIRNKRNILYLDNIPYEDYIQRLLMDLKESKLANCGEMADIAQYLLKKEGIETERISMKIMIKRDKLRPGLSDHTFLIMNIADDADFTNPKTWGNEAILIDPWFGIAKRSHMALKQIYELMNVNNKKETPVFRIYNYPDAVQAWQQYAFGDYK